MTQQCNIIVIFLVVSVYFSENYLRKAAISSQPLNGVHASMCGQCDRNKAVLVRFCQSCIIFKDYQVTILIVSLFLMIQGVHGVC